MNSMMKLTIALCATAALSVACKGEDPPPTPTPTAAKKAALPPATPAQVAAGADIAPEQADALATALEKEIADDLAAEGA